MTRKRSSRREFLASAASAATASALLPAPALAQAAPRVVVIGGGFAGASAARALKGADPRIAVTLVEAGRTFTACPFSNLVIGGLRDLKAQQFGYDKVAADGIQIAFTAATRVDAQARNVTLEGGSTLAYDRLVLAPGIDLNWNGAARYTEGCRAKCRQPGAGEHLPAPSWNHGGRGVSSCRLRPIRSAAAGSYYAPASRPLSRP